MPCIPLGYVNTFAAQYVSQSLLTKIFRTIQQSRIITSFSNPLLIGSIQPYHPLAIITKVSVIE